MDPKPRSSTGVAPNGIPDGSKATILDRGRSKWPPGWLQSHDPRQGPLKKWHSGWPQSHDPRQGSLFCLWLLGLLWVQSHDPRQGSLQMASLTAPKPRWPPGWLQSHDPRQGPLKMAPRMAPKPRSSTGATQNSAGAAAKATILDRGHSKNCTPDGPKATILDRGHSKQRARSRQSHDPRQGPLKK